MGRCSIHEMICAALVGLWALPGNAQTKETQLWSDFTLGRNFTSMYMAELEVGYQTLVEGSPQWNTLSLTPTLEASFTPHYALTERERVHLVYQARVEIDDAPEALRPGAPAEVRLQLPPAASAAR